MYQSAWLDVAMLMQNVMLASLEHGLATCPQAAWVEHAGTVRSQLGISDDYILLAGMSLGKEDLSAPVNRNRAERESVEGFANFHGY
jgi:nitroreductase